MKRGHRTIDSDNNAKQEVNQQQSFTSFAIFLTVSDNGENS
jgi:hypothetical protein